MKTLTALESVRREFPDFEEIPACIEAAVAAGTILCGAYRNDAGPSFYMPNGAPFRLFVLDLTPDRREDPTMKRFYVLADDGAETIHQGDDAEAALAALQAVAENFW